jgi:hypothetical protein
MGNFEDFIWFGDHLINLAHVACFRIKREEMRVDAVLSGVPEMDSLIQLNGEAAKRVIEALKNLKTFTSSSQYKPQPADNPNLTVDDELAKEDPPDPVS